MESLLDTLVSDKELDEAIKNSNHLTTLDALIQIKQKRLEDHRGNKVEFSISRTFEEADAELASSVLKRALLIVHDCDGQIVEALEQLTSPNQKVDRNTLRLFIVFVEFAPTIVKAKSELIRPVILSVLKGSPSELCNFLVVHLLPKYLEIDDDPKFANQIFHITKAASNCLEILCYLHRYLVNDKLLELDEYWAFLHETLSVKDLQKQGSFLLSKSIEAAFSLKCFQSQYVDLISSVAETEKAWKDFFVLFDVSNEKQLHLVEPSLRLLDSIQCLHHLWQICLYKVLLCHTQTAVVYSVALHLLQNHHLEKDNFPYNDLLVAVNRNEYSTMSDKVFVAISKHCNRSEQFERVLLESLDVTWNPIAAWCLYSNIFSDDADFQIPLALCEKIIDKLKLLPNVFIRESCIRIVCEYFTQHLYSQSVVDWLRIGFLLKNLSYNLLWTSFRSKHRFRKAELDSVIEEAIHESSPDVEFLRMLFDEFGPSPIFSDIVNDVELPKELRFMIWPELIEKGDLVDYIKWCIDCPNDAPDIRKYISLNKSFFRHLAREELGSKASNVLLEFKNRKIFSSNDLQTLSIVYEILRFDPFDQEEHEIVAHNWMDRFSNSSSKIEEPIVACFLNSFLKSRWGLCEDVVENTIFILNNVLDLDYGCTIPLIFEYLHVLDRLEKHERLIRSFIRRCFEELKKLSKSNIFLRCAMIFFRNLFNVWSLDRMTDEFRNDIYDIFHEAVESIAKDKREMAFILVSCLTHSRVFAHDFPRKGFNSIVELVLRTGSIFRRSERVEHGIYHDISLRLPKADPSNPIWIDSATKFKALDMMLIIAMRQPGAADDFTSILLEKYMQYFNKRYFPDSQLHIEKMRIIQALLLIHPFIKTSKEKMIDFIADSFLSESHQPSVRHLMQWLMIHLLSEDGISAVGFISEKLNKSNNTRPTSVTAFIPVLYQLCLLNPEETYWNAVVKTLRSYTMGAQFKLRAFSQAAIMKLYESAQQMEFEIIVKYTELYNSVKSVIESSGDPFYDVVNLENDFLQYLEVFKGHKLSHFHIYYVIPERCKVTATEWRHLTYEYRDIFSISSGDWRHLSDVYRNNFAKEHHDLEMFFPIFHDRNYFAEERHDLERFKAKMYSESCTNSDGTLTTNDNVQRKITPWKSALDEDACSTQHQTDFILITSLLEKNTNLGGLMRTCEVFGVKRLAMKTAKVVADKEFKSLSMSSENWVDIVEVKVEDVRAFILDVKSKGYRVVGAEQTTNSVQLEQFKFPQKTVLLLGNEKEGIPPDLIAVIDDFVEIPQFGVVRSLNVHVAGAIVIWEYRKQHSV